MFSIICYNQKKAAAAKYIANIENIRQKLYSRIQPSINLQKIISVVDPKNVSNDAVLYLAGFLLAFRGNNTVSDLLRIIFRGDLINYSASVFQAVSDVYMRSYNELSNDADGNFRIMYSFFANSSTQIDRDRHIVMVRFMVSSIENGSFTTKSVKTLYHVIEESNKYIYVKNDLEVSTVLLYKLLRFFQDYILMISSPPIAPYSAESMKILGLVNNVEKKFSNFFIELFKQRGKDLTAKAAKDVSRILYDPRSYIRMKKKFESIYETYETIQKSVPLCYQTDKFYVGKFLSYRNLKKVSIIFQNYVKNSQVDPGKASSTAQFELSDIFAPETELFDVDLIASDVARVLLQNMDFIMYDQLLMANFLRVILEKMKLIYSPSTASTEKKPIFAFSNPFYSFVNSIVSDLFFCPATIRVDLNSLRYFYANLNFFYNYAPIQPTMINIIAERLRNSDFDTLKRRSFAIVLGMYEKLSLPPNSFLEKLDANASKLSSERNYKDLKNVIALKDRQSIPDAVSHFRESGKAINTVEGVEVIKIAGDFIVPLVGEVIRARTCNEKCLQLINNTFTYIMPPTTDYVTLIYDKVDVFASFLYTMKSEKYLTSFLNWVIEKEKFEPIDKYFDLAPKEYQNKFEMLIAKYIRTDTLKWQNLIPKVRTLRMNERLMKTICLHAPINRVTDLIDFQKYGVIGLIKEAGNDEWHPDAQMNLITLLKCTFMTAADFNEYADFIILNFQMIPPFIVSFFESQIRLIGYSSQMNNFIKTLKLHKGKPSEWSITLAGILVSQSKSESIPSVQSVNQPIMF